MGNNRRLLIFTSIFLMAGAAVFAQNTNSNTYSLIPYPAQLQPAKGSFSINKQTALVVGEGASIFSNEQQFLKEMLQSYLGAGTLAVKQNSSKNAIVLKYDATITSPEAYRLKVSATQITLAAKSAAGMFYAIETLRQLLPVNVENSKGNTLAVAAVKIEDKPAFPWRGMHLDVSRHFFSISYLKKYVDMMALYKLNKFHLHLTDDQGWRIEIKKYPELTQQAAWRAYDRNDSACIKIAKETGNTDFNLDTQHLKVVNGKTLHGGFYTQEEMKAFIVYAASRHIEIIPEIDMPGHMQAAVKLYPYLTCDSTIGYGEGFSIPICPCNEKVIDFAKDIFSEIADLFPSKYIHIGGDEVDKRNWERSPQSQAFMKEKGFTKAEQIQSYFNDTMIKFFATKGKIMIGWDEIAETNIDATPVVMFWRAWAPQAVTQAAKNGNKYIMTADGPLYFDAIPNNHSLQEVYNYDPLNTVYRFNKEDEKGLLGVQANLWSEMIPSEKRADYLLLPRMLALAELGWTHKPLYASFVQRLTGQYARLDNLNASYRLPGLEGIVENNVFVGKANFFASFPSSYFKLRYTIDGSLPTAASPVMLQPISINKTTAVKLALFTATGRRGDVYNLSFISRQYSPAVVIANAFPGLQCAFYEGSFKVTPLIQGTPQNAIAKEVAIPKGIKVDAFGLKFTGYIEVPQTAVYSFYLNSDDGAILKIDSEKIIDNDGFHPAKEKGGQAALQKGLHAIAVDYMDGGGGGHLELRYSMGNGLPKPIPAAWFKYTK